MTVDRGLNRRSRFGQNQHYSSRSPGAEGCGCDDRATTQIAHGWCADCPECCQYPPTLRNRPFTNCRCSGAFAGAGDDRSHPPDFPTCGVVEVEIRRRSDRSGGNTLFVNKLSIVILVRVGGLCITSGDFSRWLTKPYWQWR
jgi:hypothetical protein